MKTQYWELLTVFVVQDGTVKKADVFSPGCEPRSLGEFPNVIFFLEQGWEPCGLDTLPNGDKPLALLVMQFKRPYGEADLEEEEQQLPKMKSSAHFAHRLKKDHF